MRTHLNVVDNNSSLVTSTKSKRRQSLATDMMADRRATIRESNLLGLKILNLELMNNASAYEPIFIRVPNYFDRPRQFDSRNL